MLRGSAQTVASDVLQTRVTNADRDKTADPYLFSKISLVSRQACGRGGGQGLAFTLSPGINGKGARNIADNVYKVTEIVGTSPES